MPIILAVDDEPTILQMVRFTLRRHHEVLTAESGARGLELLAEHAVDLIISDLRMPGMSGLEFLRAAHAAKPGIVSLLATAFTTHEDALVAMSEVGVFRLLAKPWQPQEVLDAVDAGLASVVRQSGAT